MASSNHLPGPITSLPGGDLEITFTHKGQSVSINEMYEDITLRLEVISEIIDDIVSMYPSERDRLYINKRIEQKLMLRKLAGE